jgi:teichuronic acid biosynthesis glycosyltransferase TuaG
MNQLISVIIPVYNSSQYLSETIVSVLNQTYSNFEIIIIDDFSSDDSLEIALSFQKNDSRIIILKNAKNSGQAFSRNVGLDCAKGIFIAFLDSDDLWHPQKLEQHLKVSVERNLVFTYSNYELINSKGKYLGILMKPSEELSFKKFLKYNSVACLTIFYHFQTFKDLRFVEDILYKNLEDNIFCAEIFKNTPRYSKISKVLAFYRIHDKSSSAQKTSMFIKRIGMLSKYYKIDLVRRAWYLTIYTIRNILKYSRIKILKIT